MTRSFYHYLMTERDGNMKDQITVFANAAFRDTDFPKQSKDYHEISHYLEMYGTYLDSMTIFDDAWERYQSTKK